MKSQHIAIAGILLASGAIVRYLSLVIPGPIVSNLVIAFYCLAIILIVPTLGEALGIGVVAGIICALISHSVFPPANLISEPIGALVCIGTYLALRGRIAAAPGLTTFVATAASGTTFILVAIIGIAPVILTKYASIGAFAAATVPIVIGTAVVNAVIAQILYMPAHRALSRGTGAPVARSMAAGNQE
ncbi:hypothetical protein [Methanofollis fontis]|uniref:hypothetical protein n=1 Tax=Methanofollis fontis TaxID=2052832 RepID=UPI001F30135C|nr:hypothetical protein [Methanofollis fontis]